MEPNCKLLNRSFYRLCELGDSMVSIINAVVGNLSSEFDGLWNSNREAFLPWHEHGQPVIGWLLFGTHFLGECLEENCFLAPIAASLGRSVGANSCGYSVLLPGTHVPPHAEDSASSETRVHIALRIPRSSGCGLRVGHQTKVWVESNVLAFDSTQEHEAWNFSTDYRAVLILDFGAERLPTWQWPKWLQTKLVDAGTMSASDFQEPGSPE